jgi:hypothetical protein
MKSILTLGLVLVALVLSAGCSSSPTSRISKNQAEFAAYPTDVQELIRKGEVRVGFTPAQVRLALGEPDRVLKRTSEAGESDVWIYQEKRSSLGFGVGFGVGGGPVGAGAGVGSGGSSHDDERMRVVFTAGRVAAIDQFSDK